MFQVQRRFNHRRSAFSRLVTTVVVAGCVMCCHGLTKGQRVRRRLAMHADQPYQRDPMARSRPRRMNPTLDLGYPARRRLPGTDDASDDKLTDNNDLPTSNSTCISSATTIVIPPKKPKSDAVENYRLTKLAAESGDSETVKTLLEEDIGYIGTGKVRRLLNIAAMHKRVDVATVILKNVGFSKNVYFMLGILEEINFLADVLKRAIMREDKEFLEYLLKAGFFSKSRSEKIVEFIESTDDIDDIDDSAVAERETNRSDHSDPTNHQVDDNNEKSRNIKIPTPTVARPARDTTQMFLSWLKDTIDPADMEEHRQRLTASSQFMYAVVVGACVGVAARIAFSNQKVTLKDAGVGALAGAAATLCISGRTSALGQEPKTMKKVYHDGTDPKFNETEPPALSKSLFW